MNLVLDPSVVIKWYVPETLTGAAVRLKEQIETKSKLVAVPALFFVESANVLWKKSCLAKELSGRDAYAIYSRIMDLPFHVVEDREVLAQAMDLASENAISVYDALYVASAIHLKATLVTADAALVRRLASSSAKRFVAFLSDYSEQG